MANFTINNDPVCCSPTIRFAIQSSGDLFLDMEAGDCGNAVAYQIEYKYGAGDEWTQEPTSQLIQNVIQFESWDGENDVFLRVSTVCRDGNGQLTNSSPSPQIFYSAISYCCQVDVESVVPVVGEPENLHVIYPDESDLCTETKRELLTSTNGVDWVDTTLMGPSPITVPKPVVTTLYRIDTICVDDSKLEGVPYQYVPTGVPTLIETSNTDTGPDGFRTQEFEVGEDILEGVEYVLLVYGVSATYITQNGDNVEAIVDGLIAAVNIKTEEDWDANNSAPVSGTLGFKPAATKVLTTTVRIVVNYQNSFLGYTQ